MVEFCCRGSKCCSATWQLELPLWKLIPGKNWSIQEFRIAQSYLSNMATYTRTEFPLLCFVSWTPPRVKIIILVHSPYLISEASIEIFFFFKKKAIQFNHTWLAFRSEKLPIWLTKLTGFEAKKSNIKHKSLKDDQFVITLAILNEARLELRMNLHHARRNTSNL